MGFGFRKYIYINKDEFSKKTKEILQKTGKKYEDLTFGEIVEILAESVNPDIKKIGLKNFVLILQELKDFGIIPDIKIDENNEILKKCSKIETDYDLNFQFEGLPILEDWKWNCCSNYDKDSGNNKKVQEILEIHGIKKFRDLVKKGFEFVYLSKQDNNIEEICKSIETELLKYINDEKKKIFKALVDQLNADQRINIDIPDNFVNKIPEVESLRNEDIQNVFGVTIYSLEELSSQTIEFELSFRILWTLEKFERLEELLNSGNHITEYEVIAPLQAKMKEGTVDKQSEKEDNAGDLYSDTIKIESRFNPGEKLVKEEDVKKGTDYENLSVAELEKLINSNDEIAMLELGKRYILSLDEQDQVEGFNLINTASCTLKSVNTIFPLEYCYINGIGTTQNIQKAKELLSSIKDEDRQALSSEDNNYLSSISKFLNDFSIDLEKMLDSFVTLENEIDLPDELKEKIDYLKENGIINMEEIQELYHIFINDIGSKTVCTDELYSCAEEFLQAFQSNYPLSYKPYCTHLENNLQNIVSQIKDKQFSNNKNKENRFIRRLFGNKLVIKFNDIKKRLDVLDKNDYEPYSVILGRNWDVKKTSLTRENFQEILNYLNDDLEKIKELEKNGILELPIHSEDLKKFIEDLEHKINNDDELSNIDKGIEIIYKPYYISNKIASKKSINLVEKQGIKKIFSSLKTKLSRNKKDSNYDLITDSEYLTRKNTKAILNYIESELNNGRSIPYSIANVLNLLTLLSNEITNPILKNKINKLKDKIEKINNQDEIDKLFKDEEILNYKDKNGEILILADGQISEQISDSKQSGDLEKDSATSSKSTEENIIIKYNDVKNRILDTDKNLYFRLLGDDWEKQKQSLNKNNLNNICNELDNYLKNDKRISQGERITFEKFIKDLKEYIKNDSTLSNQDNKNTHFYVKGPTKININGKKIALKALGGMLGFGVSQLPPAKVAVKGIKLAITAVMIGKKIYNIKTKKYDKPMQVTSISSPSKKLNTLINSATNYYKTHKNLQYFVDGVCIGFTVGNIINIFDNDLIEKGISNIFDKSDENINSQITGPWPVENQGDFPIEASSGDISPNNLSVEGRGTPETLDPNISGVSITGVTPTELVQQDYQGIITGQSMDFSSIPEGYVSNYDFNQGNSVNLATEYFKNVNIKCFELNGEQLSGGLQELIDSGKINESNINNVTAFLQSQDGTPMARVSIEDIAKNIDKIVSNEKTM